MRSSRLRRTVVAMLALAAVASASAGASAQDRPASQESPWATRAPATPVPVTGNERVNVIHGAAITPEQRMFAENFIQSVRAKDPAKVRALIAPTTLQCFDKSKEQFLEDWIQKQFRYQVPLDCRTSVSQLPPKTFKSSKLATYPVPATHLLQFQYSNANKTVTVNQLVGQEDGQWYLIPPCPTEEGMERFARSEKMRVAGQERAERLYPQLQEPLKSQLLALIAKHDNSGALKLCMRSLHVDYMTARALIAKLGGEQPD